MNTTNASASVSSALLAAPYQIHIWFGLFLWITGNLGSIGNIIVFRSSTFRNRAYSLYLFYQAISDLFYYDFVLLTRILQFGFQIPIMIRFDVICKIRQFSSVWGNQISVTFFTFATIDRLLSAQRNNNYRQWSNRIPLAYKLMVASLVVWFFLIGHRLIFYYGGNGKCGPLAGAYAAFDDYLEAVVNGVLPPILTSILAYLLIRSVRNVIHRRIIPVDRPVQVMTVHRTTLQQIDAQLSTMLILQSIVSTLTYGPYAVNLIYSNVTVYYTKSPLRIAQERVFYATTDLGSYIFFATGFYVSMISSSGFRREFKRIIFNMKRHAPLSHTQTVARTGVTYDLQPR